jgi:hypothetical protein
MESVGIFGLFYGHLVNFVDIWNILWLFDTFSPRFGILYQEKSGNPGYVHLRTNPHIVKCGAPAGAPLLCNIRKYSVWKIVIFTKVEQFIEWVRT